MFKKILATVVTATFSFSTTSAFAVNNEVHVIANCVAYNDRGDEIAILEPDYYRVVEFIVFKGGDEGVKVLASNRRTRHRLKVNISTDCLESSERLIR